MRLSLGRIADFTSACGEFDHNACVSGYSIDSRTLARGQLFFAVKGENHDGHDFVEAALAQGAAAAVVRKDQLPRYSVKTRLLAVDDTLAALQATGAAARRLWGKTLLGVTGSVGKTTTKDAIAVLLATRYRVMKSEGNLNNHFGLPLQLLKLEPGHDIAVVELGMSHAGEIAALARMAQPDIGVVTSVAPVHLEFFDSLAGIARAKYELIEALPHGGVAVLNADDEYVSQFGRDFHGRVVTYGFSSAADVRAENVEDHASRGSSFDLVVGAAREHATLPLIGRHNVSNALAAAAVGLQRAMTPSEVAAALAQIRPADKRGQTLTIGGATVVNDCYNSNPKALNAMVDALASMPAQRRIVVAGEMLELGPTSDDLHRGAGEHMAGRGVDFVIAVRGHARAIADAAAGRGLRTQFVETPEDAAEILAREVCKGDVVLLKASRGVRLERALERWQALAASKT